MTPKQHAELAAIECSLEIAKLVGCPEEELKQFASQVTELGGCISNSLPLEQLFAVEDALRAFVARLTAIHDDPEYLTVWMSYQNHGGDYTNGPKYDKELQNAETLLLALDNWRKERNREGKK